MQVKKKEKKKKTSVWFVSRDVINTVRGFSQPAKSEILQDSENLFLRNPYLYNVKNPNHKKCYMKCNEWWSYTV